MGKLQTQPLPDIILSDVMMPEMDGNELCKLAKGNELTADIPFVVLTARLASEHKKEGLENGADEYITKPFDIDLLNLRIRNLMKWAKRKMPILATLSLFLLHLQLGMMPCLLVLLMRVPSMVMACLWVLLLQMDLCLQLIQ